MQLQINLLEAHYKQKADMEEGSVGGLKALGAEICKAQYKSAVSSWQYETPQQVLFICFFMICLFVNHF
jgi:hypothetical protein